MLQILSTSNETATGPELVTDGDFTATGSDLITNGDFSATGSELVVNGDFSGGTFSPWANNPNWSLGGVGAIADGTSDATLWQSGVVEDNKSYKVTYTLSDFTQGSVNVDLGGTDGATRTTAGTYTDYIVSGTSPTTRLTFEGSGSFIVTLSNVSVKELGAGWTINDGWSIGEDKAIWDADSATQNENINQAISFGTGTSYKVSFTIADVVGSPVRILMRATGVTNQDITASWESLTGGTYTRYFSSLYSNTQFDISGRYDAGDSFSITSITVQELGEDWTQGIGWTIGDSKAISAQALGGELITNGDFSATGGELITNGDFSTGVEQADALTSWTVYKVYPSTVTYDGSTAELNIGSGNENVGIYQSGIFALGVSYKIVVSMKATASFDAEIVESSGAATINTIGTVSLTTSYQDFTFYYVGTGTYDLFIHRLYSGSGASQTISIETVSVEELGEDWVSVDDTNTFGENGVTMTSTEAAAVKVRTLAPVADDNKSYKVTYTIHSIGLTGTNTIQYYTGSATDSYNDLPGQSVGTHTFYYTAATIVTNNKWYFKLNLAGGSTSTTDFVTISSLSVEELGEGWTLGTGWSMGEDEAIFSGTAFATLSPTSPIIEEEKSYKITFDATVTNGSFKLQNSSTDILISSEGGSFVEYFTAVSTSLTFARAGVGIQNDFTITNISVEEIATSYLAQDGILTVNRTYKFGYTISNYSAGTVSATDYGAVKDEDEVVLDTVKVEGVDFSIKNIDGYFVGDIESVSAKLLGTYLEQSIYVTAADIQTIAQASVYYLVELTSMASKNSLYFLPSSVVANNGRYTKLNFTVISKDATPTPAVGIISFYDSVGGFDTYPMGFYEFKIYEQTSSTNLDPSLATGLLEKGFAFVRDFSGNMQELTDDFNEYNPTLTQYVYSK